MDSATPHHDALASLLRSAHRGSTNGGEMKSLFRHVIVSSKRWIWISPVIVKLFDVVVFC